MLKRKLSTIFTSCLTAAILSSNAYIPANAATKQNVLDKLTASVEQSHTEEIQTDTTQNLNGLNISQSISLGSLNSKSFKYKSKNIAYHVDAQADTNGETPAEPDHLTQSFTDYLTSEDEMKNISFTLTEGSILNASLNCPSNPNLDYNLVLGSIADDGSVTVMKVSSLGTYIDPQTGKTVDEGISYIHNQGTAGNFALFVMSSAGSSTTDSFTLTVSLSNPGTFDTNEPNDSAFEATQISGLTSSGSLHVENDQDWYVTNLNSGVYEVTADSYNADIYYVTDGNKLVKSEQLGKRYVLDSGTYYIKVSSDKTGDSFTPGNYTLRTEDKTVYSTINTAFDFGNWKDAYYKNPQVVPRGQQTAFYKFSIAPEDKIYASRLLSSSDDGTIILFLNDRGQTIDYGFSGSASMPDTPARGVVKYGSNNQYSKLVVNIDGSQTNGFGYLQIIKVNPASLFSGGTPFLYTRIKTGRGTFSFSGTAKCSGHSTSSSILLDLTNNSNIPNRAVVTEASTTSNISYNVGGVHHMLNPGGMGWIESASTGATGGTFRNLKQYGNIQAKQPWQFCYTQTAYKATTMNRVNLNLTYEYDIQYTNYELFNN